MNYEENIWNNDVTEAPQPDVKDTPEIEQYREKSHQIHSTYIPWKSCSSFRNVKWWYKNLGELF